MDWLLAPFKITLCIGCVFRLRFARGFSDRLVQRAVVVAAECGSIVGCDGRVLLRGRVDDWRIVDWRGCSIVCGMRRRGTACARRGVRGHVGRRLEVGCREAGQWSRKVSEMEREKEATEQTIQLFYLAIGVVGSFRDCACFRPKRAKCTSRVTPPSLFGDVFGRH